MRADPTPRTRPLATTQPLRRLVRTLGPLAAATLALGAAAQNTNTVTASGSAGPVFDVTEIGLPAMAGNAAPIDLATWHSGESQFAAASGASLTLRAVAATRGDSNQLQTTSSFNWTIPVQAGGAAIVGSPVTVTVAFRIDGRSAAGYGVAFNSGGGAIFLPSEFQLSSWVGTHLRLDVYDLDAPDYEGGAPTARAEFSSGNSVESALYAPSLSYPTGAEYTTVGHDAQLTMNDPIAGSTAWSGNTNYYQAYGRASPTGHVFDVDSGWLSLSFDTFVGNRIGFEGQLGANIYCSSYSSITPSPPSCAGLSDYGSTFDAELSASVAGVTFGDYTPGVFAPVPEPATWALMFVGVAVLLRRVRGAGAAARDSGR